MYNVAYISKSLFSMQQKMFLKTTYLKTVIQINTYRLNKHSRLFLIDKFERKTKIARSPKA